MYIYEVEKKELILGIDLQDYWLPKLSILSLYFLCCEHHHQFPTVCHKNRKHSNLISYE